MYVMYVMYTHCPKKGCSGLGWGTKHDPQEGPANTYVYLCVYGILTFMLLIHSLISFKAHKPPQPFKI